MKRFFRYCFVLAAAIGPKVATPAESPHIAREAIEWCNIWIGLVKDHPEWWSADGVHFDAQGVGAEPPRWWPDYGGPAVGHTCRIGEWPRSRSQRGGSRP